MSGPLPLGTRVRIIVNSRFAGDTSQRYVGQAGVTVDNASAPDVRLDSGKTVTCDQRELEILPAPPADPKGEKRAAIEQAMSEYWAASRVLDAAYDKVQALMKP